MTIAAYIVHLNAMHVFGSDVFYYRIINRTNVNIVINASLVKLLLQLGGERGTVDLAKGIDLGLGPELDDLFDVSMEFRLVVGRILLAKDTLSGLVERDPDVLENGGLLGFHVGNDLGDNCFQNLGGVLADGLGGVLKSLVDENQSVKDLGVFCLADGAADGLLKGRVIPLGIFGLDLDAIEKVQLYIGVELSVLSLDPSRKERDEDAGIVSAGKGDNGQESKEGEKKKIKIKKLNHQVTDVIDVDAMDIGRESAVLHH